MMTCKTCWAYVPKTSADGKSYVGRCRFHAPTLKGWPVMFPADWCLDHKLDENALIPPPSEEKLVPIDLPELTKTRKK
jgi:hypothetical protein